MSEKLTSYNIGVDLSKEPDKSKELLFAVIECPKCSKLHHKPECFYPDDNQMNGLQIICPNTGESFAFRDLAPSQINPEWRLIRCD